jgi:Ca2+-binding EF-hand superfamily protein
MPEFDPNEKTARFLRRKFACAAFNKGQRHKVAQNRKAKPMKTKLMTGLVLAAVTLTAGMALARDGGMRPDFATLDLDGDGMVTLAEMQAQPAARFTAADTDADGALSLQELTAQLANGAADRAARMLERLDENGDGLVQSSEMAARATGQMDRMFDRLDADNDGNLTAAEFDAAPMHGQGRDGHGHGKRG